MMKISDQLPPGSIGFDPGTLSMDYAAPYEAPQQMPLPEAKTIEQDKTPWLLYGAVALLGAIIIWADWNRL